MFVPTHACLTSVLDAWQQNCPEIYTTALSTYCMCTVCVLYVCDISCLHYLQVRHMGMFYLQSFSQLILNAWYSGHICKFNTQCNFVIFLDPKLTHIVTTWNTGHS